MTSQSIVSGATQVNPEFWLNAAHAAIRRECGWHVAPVITETLTLDGSGSRTLLLPSGRVASIASVKNDGVDVTSAVRLSARTGVLTLATRWTAELGAVEITLTHGYPVEDVPDLAALIVTLTSRAASALRSTVAQQSIGGASVRYLTGVDGGPLGLPLLESEKQTLAPYKLAWGS